MEVRVEGLGYSSKVRVFTAGRTGTRVVKRCVAPKTRRLRPGCG
jgi:hypothetical protein